MDTSTIIGIKINFVNMFQSFMRKKKSKKKIFNKSIFLLDFFNKIM